MKWYDICNRISLLLHALVSAAGYFLIEAISRHSFTEAWDFMTGRPLVFAYNAALIFTSSLIVYLFRRRCFIRVLLVMFWLLLGIINGVILATRVTPFTGPDLHLLTDGMALLEKYLPKWGVIVALIVLGLFALTLLALIVKGPKFKGKLKYRWNIPLVLAGFVLFAGVTQLALEKRVLSNYFGNIAFAYEDYGYPYCLGVTIFDPELVNYLEISEDPIPNFRKMMKEYTSGYYKVPSVGAGTANTEFESITGMSLRYFGPGEYPYKSILKETTCESAPYVLGELGYSSHAIHNNEANFYGRRSIFPNLGFDTFTSAEYMPEEDDKNPLGWTRDRVLTDEILKCLDSTEDQPDYVYTISVQGHGAYPEEPELEEHEITVTGSPTASKNNQWEYYVNQIHEMDNFVKELTDRLEDYPEDVVLVMYGDHLPTMGLTVEDVDNKYLFQTQYVMWDNFGLEKKDVNLAAYQMAAEVLDRVGIHEGTVFRYHQARRNTKNYQVDLETLQYDLLYGEQHSYEGENPFKRTKMRLGLYDVTLDGVSLVSAWDHTYRITGTNFTPSSQVKLNGEWHDTIYVNPTTLMISGTELEDFDRLSVVQRSNSSTRKALSKSYDRSCYMLFDENKWKLPTEDN